MKGSSCVRKTCSLDHPDNRTKRAGQPDSPVFLVAKSTANRAPIPAFEDGVVRVKADYPLPEAIDRMRQDIAAKGIMMFSTIDQAKLPSPSASVGQRRPWLRR